MRDPKKFSLAFKEALALEGSDMLALTNSVWPLIEPKAVDLWSEWVSERLKGDEISMGSLCQACLGPAKNAWPSLYLMQAASDWGRRAIFFQTTERMLASGDAIGALLVRLTEQDWKMISAHLREQEI